ncbi:MAG: DUF116 domain-containing protein [archaeon]|nr:DUF116 domain-containing protein [archaeon]
MIIPYELIGKIAVYGLIAVFSVLIVAMGLGFYSFKKRRILFPNFVLFVLDLLYSPAKWVCRVFSIRSTLVDEIMIEVRNAVLLERFRAAGKDKILVGPQCMRHPECKARCEPRVGYICLGCGRCDFSRLKKECDKYGYKMFIVPGDSFVRKIIKLHKPKAALGIACFGELNESMHELSPVLPVQGVALLRDGCFNTAVNVEDVIEKMRS